MENAGEQDPRVISVLWMGVEGHLSWYSQCRKAKLGLRVLV